MIGQTNVLLGIDKMISSEKFPHFVIIHGQKGSGKTLVVKHIAQALKCPYTQVAVTSEDLRNLCENAQKASSPIVYHVRNADNLKQRNAILLKITEDCPSMAYIVMTVENMQSVLPTLQSRAHVIKMDNYSKDELIAYANATRAISKAEGDAIGRICSTCSDVDKLLEYGVEPFNDFIELTVDNINRVCGANAFKMAEKIAFNSEDSGFDLKLFLRAFMEKCCERITLNPVQYSLGIRETSQCLQQLSVVGINKRSLFDMWILNIRKQWWQYEHVTSKTADRN